MNFTMVNIKEYVEKGLSSGILKPIEAAKVSKVSARQGQVGQIVETYSQNGILETTNTVSLDETTKEPGWIISKMVDGQIAIDEFGHANEYIVSDSDFKRMYERDSETPELFRSKADKRLFVQTPSNISFNTSWGEEMNILAGGYLNITNPEDIYGIQERDFLDTYQIIENQNKKSL